jgi:Protein of unknown function (DUF2442)
MPILDDKLRDVVNIRFEPHVMILEFADGGAASAPYWWYPRLLNASQAERENYQLSGRGRGIHWPDIDEDLSVNGILEGRKAPGAKIPQVAAE